MADYQKIYIPLDPVVSPLDGAGFVQDIDMQFRRMAASPVSGWWNRFAYEPPGASEDLQTRMPVELTTFGFEEYKGTPTFRGSERTSIDINIGKFWEGTQLDTRRLRGSSRTGEIEAWNQRGAMLFESYARFMPPRIYAMLSAGKTPIPGGQAITGGTAYFATDHKVNLKNNFGTFSNLVDESGDLAANPIYFMWRGAQFDMMRPWQIRVGAGPANSMTAGGIMHTATPGMPWTVRWIPETDSQAMDANFMVKWGVYVEKGWGLLFPQTCWRYEGTLDYAGLKSVIDIARGMKDLNGYNPADQIALEAILCEPSQVSTINGLLGREVTDTGARQVDLRIDATLQGAAVIPMSR